MGLRNTRACLSHRTDQTGAPTTQMLFRGITLGRPNGARPLARRTDSGGLHFACRERVLRTNDSSSGTRFVLRPTSKCFSLVHRRVLFISSPSARRVLSVSSCWSQADRITGDQLTRRPRRHRTGLMSSRSRALDQSPINRPRFG